MSPLPLRHRALAVLAGGALIAGQATLVPSGAAATDGCSSYHWVGSWAAAPSDAGVSRQLLADQTLRMIVTPHLAGSTVRVRLTNRLGQSAVTLGPVTLAKRTEGAAVAEGSLRALTFGGQPSVTIPAGRDVLSDPVRLTFTAFEDLAVSVAVGHAVLLPTEHSATRQTSYLSPIGSGAHTGDVDGAAFTEESHTNGSSTGWYLLAGLDVRAPRSTGALVVFGDSITDGFQGQANVVSEDLSTVDRNARYPDFLQRRLDRAGIPLSVLNLGISGNRLLQDGLEPRMGPSGLSRFKVDALSQAGVTEILLLEGINDIGQGHAGMSDLAPAGWTIEGGLTAEQLIAGYRTAIRRAHRAGLRITLGTLTPAGGTAVPSYGNDAADALRREVNRWIRSQRRSDGVVDFDAAVRDPAHRSRIRPDFDGGDHLHFSAAGYRAMAKAVKLSALATPSCVG